MNTPPISISFPGLVSRLSRVDVPPPMNTDRPGIATIPERLKGYIEPALEVVAWPAGAPIVVIEAAGAVGKTAAAQSLAADLNWPLVMSNQTQIGSFTLSGLILDSQGYDASYLQSVGQGMAGLVVDAIDEAHLKAGTANLEAFLHDVGNLAGAATDGRNPSIVLLSRSDTAEFIRTILDEADFSYALLRLSYFGRDASNRFIESYLEQRWESTSGSLYNVAKASRRPFEMLRDERLRQLGLTLAGSDFSLTGSWAEAAPFLGYAPVLIAIAEVLAVANPSSELSKVQRDGGKSRWELLEGILGSILDREQKKVADNLTVQLTAILPAHRDFGYDRIYSREEQLHRVFARARVAEAPRSLPADLPSSVREVYETAVQQFTADHPFLRGREFSSVVFSDYVYARLCTAPTLGVTGGPLPYPSGSEIGSFFAPFIVKTGSPVPERALEALVWSWRQGASVGRNGRRSAYINSSQDVTGIILIDGGEEREKPVFHTMAISDATGVLTLDRVPENLTLVTDSGLSIGRAGIPLSLSDGLFVIASEVEIESDTLEALSDSHTVLFAERITAPRLRSVQVPVDALQIYSDHVPPQLARYCRPMARGVGPTGPLDYVGLRAILTSFAKTVHIGICAQGDVVDQIAHKGGHQRMRIIGELVTRGVISREGDWYILDTAKLVSVGFSLADLKRGEPSPGVRAFLLDCAQS